MILRGWSDRVNTAAAILITVLAIYDGDTLTAEVPELGRTSVRVLGLDCPERGWRARCEAERQAADAARVAAVELLRSGEPVTLTEADRRDRYGRLLARVWVGDRSLSETLIDAGHCKRYGRRSAAAWCR
jgi:micrococcal nuclease